MPRGYSAETGRGAAAGATRTFRGDGSRRRRGCHAERQVAAAPREPRDPSAASVRGGTRLAAAAPPHHREDAAPAQIVDVTNNQQRFCDEFRWDVRGAQADAPERVARQTCADMGRAPPFDVAVASPTPRGYLSDESRRGRGRGRHADIPWR